MIPTSALSSHPGPDGSPKARPLSEVRALIERVCADLPRDLPESQAAALLLMARETGPNVDRLVLRTGFPREFVARCLRRLTDNSCWEGGEMRTSWCEDPTLCKDFWLDVEVALGRSLRRLDEEGRPEWAPSGEWVKYFDYRGARAADDALQTSYYDIVPDGSDPEQLEEPATIERAAPDPLPSSPPASDAVPPDPPEEDDEELSAPTPMLVDAWSVAEWLG